MNNQKKPELAKFTGSHKYKVIIGPDLFKFKPGKDVRVTRIKKVLKHNRAKKIECESLKDVVLYNFSVTNSKRHIFLTGGENRKGELQASVRCYSV